jgi:hypothetical protein
VDSIGGFSLAEEKNMYEGDGTSDTPAPRVGRVAFDDVVQFDEENGYNASMILEHMHSSSATNAHTPVSPYAGRVTTGSLPRSPSPGRSLYVATPSIPTREQSDGFNFMLGSLYSGPGDTTRHHRVYYHNQPINNVNRRLRQNPLKRSSSSVGPVSLSGEEYTVRQLLGSKKAGATESRLVSSSPLNLTQLLKESSSSGSLPSVISGSNTKDRKIGPRMVNTISASSDTIFLTSDAIFVAFVWSS